MGQSLHSERRTRLPEFKPPPLAPSSHRFPSSLPPKTPVPSCPSFVYKSNCGFQGGGAEGWRPRRERLSRCLLGTPRLSGRENAQPKQEGRGNPSQSRSGLYTRLNLLWLKKLSASASVHIWSLWEQSRGVERLRRTEQDGAEAKRQSGWEPGPGTAAAALLFPNLSLSIPQPHQAPTCPTLPKSLSNSDIDLSVGKGQGRRLGLARCKRFTTGRFSLVVFYFVLFYFLIKIDWEEAGNARVLRLGYSDDSRAVGI